MNDLLIRNIGVLATPRGAAPRRGKAQEEITVTERAAVAVRDGVITYAGPEADAPGEAREVLDAQGALVTPGLVDAHTHLVFGGWRQHELARKLAGASYIEILQSGGGILSTVRSTRAATEQQLTDKARAILREMLAHGVTTCEAKSGYGLSVEDECKQLRAIRTLPQEGPVRLVPTFLGAHALPEEYREDREAFIRLVVEEMIPRVAAEKLARFCDVFCEEAVFTAEETERILRAAQAHGMDAKIHADEIECIGGSELAAKLHAVSAEHLIMAKPDAITAMSESGVIGVLLPATSFYLDKTYAPAREMLDKGMAVAVASDFNPGSSPSCNLQLAMNIACLKYRLAPGEVLTAVTLNAAAAVGMADQVGSVEPGKRADLVVWDAPDLEYILYRFGSNLARTVIVDGVVQG